MFEGMMSRGEFAKAAAIRISAFLVVTFAFPFVLRYAVLHSGCAIDSCGAVSLMLSFFGKPAIYLLFVFSMLNITVRRLRDAGIPPALMIVLPIMLLADLGFALSVGAPWSAGFAAGELAPTIPKFMLAAGVCVIFLCIVPEGRPEDWGWVGGVALALLLVITAHAALNLVSAFAPFTGSRKLMEFYIQLIRPLAPYLAFIPYVVASLAVVLTFAAWRQYRRA